MMTVFLTKPNKDTNLFNRNQKCWVLAVTGSCDIQVIGKHRGRGRYIVAWLHDGEYNALKEIPISDEFYKHLSKIGGFMYGSEKQ